LEGDSLILFVAWKCFHFVEDISWQSYLDSFLVSIEKGLDAVSRLDSVALQPIWVVFVTLLAHLGR
jgi:hypothetical protein